MLPKSLAVLFALFVLLACENEQPSKLFLHIWWEADSAYMPPPHMIKGLAPYGEGSRIGLHEAIYRCGVRRFVLVTAGGELVYFPSTVRDREIVRCVQQTVSFEFNAARAVEGPTSLLNITPAMEVRP